MLTAGATVTACITALHYAAVELRVALGLTLERGGRGAAQHQAHEMATALPYWLLAAAARRHSSCCSAPRAGVAPGAGLSGRGRDRGVCGAGSVRVDVAHRRRRRVPSGFSSQAASRTPIGPSGARAPAVVCSVRQGRVSVRPSMSPPIAAIHIRFGIDRAMRHDARVQPRVTVIHSGRAICAAPRGRSTKRSAGAAGLGPTTTSSFFESGGTVARPIGMRAACSRQHGPRTAGGWGGVTLACNVAFRRRRSTKRSTTQRAAAAIGREPARAFWAATRGLHRSRRPPLGGRAQPALDAHGGRRGGPPRLSVRTGARALKLPASLPMPTDASLFGYR